MLEQKLIHLIVNGGLPIIFLLLFLEAFPLLGTLIPGQFIILLVGVLIATIGIYPFLLVFIVILFATYLGDVFSFLLAKKCENLNLKKYGLDKNSVLYKNSQRFFNKFGFLSIILGRQLNLTRAYMPFIAGLSGMETFFFLIVSLISCFLWSFLSLFLGYTFGFFIVDRIAFILEFTTIFLFYVVIISLAFFSFMKFRKENVSLFKFYPLKNIILIGIFLIFMVCFIFLEIWDYSPLISEYFYWFYFPSLHVYTSFLLKPLFLFLFYFIFLMILLFMKKILFLLIFVWSTLTTSFLTLIFNLFLKELISQRLYISVIFLGVIIFMISFLIKETYKNNKNNYYYFYQISLILFLILVFLTMYSLTLNFILIILSFLFCAVICELVLIFSHYNFFSVKNNIKIKKIKK